MHRLGSVAVDLRRLEVVRRAHLEADAFAVDVTGSATPLITALKSLSKENLSNLTPHPFYVFINYSHPPMTTRLAALRAL